MAPAGITALAAVQVNLVKLILEIRSERSLAREDVVVPSGQLLPCSARVLAVEASPRRGLYRRSAHMLLAIYFVEVRDLAPAALLDMWERLASVRSPSDTLLVGAVRLAAAMANTPTFSLPAILLCLGTYGKLPSSLGLGPGHSPSSK